MSLDRLRIRARRFERRIRWRNASEYVGGGVGVALLSPAVWSDGHPVVRAGAALLIAGCGYVMYQLYTRGAAAGIPEGLGEASCLEFHRRELARQRDLLQSVWSWYLLPFVPGMALFVTGVALARPGSWLFAAAMGAALALVFVGIAWLNAKAAAALQRQLDELEHHA